MKHTKKLFIHSLLILTLCVSMFTGTTFAWFTDSVSTSNNIITAGNLDIEMYWTDKLNGDETVWNDVEADGAEPIFNYDNWEPGYTEVRYIKLVNAGSLAMNYQLTLKPTGTVGKLAEVINVYFGENGDSVDSREDLGSLNSLGLLNSVINGGATASGTLLAADENSPLHKSGEIIVTLAMSMISTAGNEYQNESIGDGFTITAMASQCPYEADSFDNNYDGEADYPTVLLPGNASATVTPVEGKIPEGGVTLTDGVISAFVPEGVVLEEGADKIVLTVTPLENTTSDITVVNQEILIPVDVHIEGVSPVNTVPIIINLGSVMPKYLNMGNYHLYHVEDDINKVMTLVDGNEDLTTHNQFTYDSDTGAVTVAMATFSEVAMVADTGNPWGGDYNQVDTEFKGAGKDTDPYLISNADELAGLSVLISTDEDDEDTDNDWGNKYYKLISDIDINGNIFYPIGYRKIGDGYNSAGETWYKFGGAFTGNFDGAGHTITGIHQNTWEMDGNYDAGYYKAAMGLFGYVYDGTVKNLTIDDFTSEGEFAPTGCVTAYGGGNATFENIAITKSHPQTYNTGVAGIVGWDNGGDTTSDASSYTFRNITIDDNTKISALWGSWDVAAAGIMGYLGQYSSAHFENCKLAPTIDVYNDVCGNYQYYWYRYCGMMIGTVDRTNGDGSLALTKGDAKITAKNCTVDFGDRHEYYYCEFIDNTIASYTHDYQFSRVEHSELDLTVTPVTCTHTHSDKTEVINGKTVLVEDKRAVYLPFRQLFGGYGWGVDGVEEYDNIEITNITGTKEKFELREGVSTDFLFRVGNQNEFPVGKLFKAIDGADVNNSGVYVSVTSLIEGVEITGEFELNESDWTQSTLKINGSGIAKITIQDYNFCTPMSIIVEVVAAKNVTNYSNLTNDNCVLLDNITMSDNGKYSLYDNKTLYGNGFEFNVEAGQDHDTEGGYVGGNGTVWLRNSTLDNVIIKGEVYTKYGGTVKSEYNFPTVLALGNSVIANSYISNGAAAVRVGSGCNLEIINTTLEGGNFANLDIRGGKIKLKDVTTINQSTADGKSISNDKGVVGLGIVVYTGSTVELDVDGLTQYNCVSKNTSFSNSDANKLKDVIFSSTYSDYQFEYDGTTWVNTGIISMVAEVKGDNIDDIVGYIGKDASIAGYAGYVYAPAGGDNATVNAPSSHSSEGQYQIAPVYEFDYTTKNNIPQTSESNDYCIYDETTGRYLISFDDGESFEWDADILTVKKGGTPVEYTVSVDGNLSVSKDNKISFDSAGNYTVTYSYEDSENYRLNKETGKIEKYSAVYIKKVNITVYEVVDTSAKTEFAFGSNGYRTAVANSLTYVMPDVNKTSAHNKTATGTGIGIVTVDGVDVYYPIISMQKSGSSSWYNYFSVFNPVTITDLNGTVHSTSTTELPSGLTVIGGFILDANGNISAAESANGTGIFNYSTGKEIKCATYSSYGLCYYPDSKFTKTGTSDRPEQTIVVKYRYTDSNGTPYYYYVGYWCEKHTKSTCVTPDTLITLADGSHKEIQYVTYSDELLVWDFVNGEYTTAPSSIVMNHGYDNYDVVTLNFADGTVVKTINGHGFYDAELNKFVIIGKDNVAELIGHKFVKQCGTAIELVDYSIHTEYTESWSVLTAEHYNCMLEGMLTVTPAEVEGSPDYLMPYAVGGDMKYDVEAMQADIEKYGLYTYEEFAEVLTEEQFYALGIQNFKVAVGKGYITYDEILYLIDLHMN